MRVVALSVPFPGVSRVLKESEKVGMLKFCPIGGDRVAIPPADVYILGAYHPFYDQLLPHLDGKIGVLWTSSAGEMQLEPVEQDYLHRLLVDPRIDFIWFGDPGLAAVFKDKGFYSPYPMSLDVQRPDVPKQDIVTLFCPTTAKKNILTQILAVALVQREVDVTLHVNFGIDPALKAATGLRVVEHGWLERGEYVRLLASSRANLAVSLAETFCYAAAESVLMGTPCVLSSAIPWAPMGDTSTVDAPGSIEDIVSALRAVLTDNPEKCLLLQEASLRLHITGAREKFEARLSERFALAS